MYQVCWVDGKMGRIATVNTLLIGKSVALLGLVPLDNKTITEGKSCPRVDGATYGK